jgi:hypothetical protein
VSTRLDKRLNAAPPLQLLGAHSPRNFSRVTLNASNDSMGIRPLLGSFIDLLDNDDLLACLTALQDDGDLDNNERIRIAAASVIHMRKALFRACKLVSMVRLWTV